MFTTCEQGHDLTVEGAWLYDGIGNRKCRACANPKKREKVVHGAFDGGMSK